MHETFIWKKAIQFYGVTVKVGRDMPPIQDAKSKE